MTCYRIRKPALELRPGRPERAWRAVLMWRTSWLSREVVLLPAFMTDWRWLTERDDSPWYPGVMRLFRQAEPDDWDSVIEAVRDALAARLTIYTSV